MVMEMGGIESVLLWFNGYGKRHYAAEIFINPERPFMNMGSEIIYRDEAEEIKELKGWILVYGRHKVGKTF